MKLTANRRSRRNVKRHSKHSRRRSRTYAVAVPLTQRMGELIGRRSSSGKDSAHAQSDLAGTASRVLALLLALSMVGVLIWFFVDYRFFVYSIAVHGTSSVTPGDVYQATGLNEMSIFYINRAKAAEQVLDKLIAVQSTSVSCALPARVDVKLQERVAAYSWQSGGNAYLVDQEGLVLRLDDGLRPDRVTIQHQDGGQLDVGDRVDTGILRTVQQLNALLPQTTRFQYSEAMGISLAGEQGLVIHIGDGQDLHTKVASIEAILREIVSTGDSAQLIDVRFVDSPYYR